MVNDVFRDAYDIPYMCRVRQKGIFWV